MCITMLYPPAKRNSKVRQEATAPVPQPPKDGMCYSGAVQVPTWIIPMTLAIMNGTGPDAAVNGIGLDDAGDLLLYRKVNKGDWDRLPELIGISEIWIAIELPITD